MNAWKKNGAESPTPSGAHCRGDRIAGDLACGPPRREEADRAEQRQHRDHSGVSAGQKRRCDEGRQPGGVNRVDRAVLAPSQVVRAEIALDVRRVVTPLVVVFDAKVAVLEQALRDDQVVRLVAAGNPWREPPGRRQEQRRQDDDGGDRTGRRDPAYRHPTSRQDRNERCRRQDLSERADP